MTAITKETLVLKNYINGKWVDALSTETLDVPNPATGEILARVPFPQKRMLIKLYVLLMKHLRLGKIRLFQNGQEFYINIIII